MNKIIYCFLLIFVVVGSFLLGLYVDILFDEHEKTIGLYSNDFCGYDGNWIHIKIEENSNYRRLVEVCNHESGHELFCELNDESNCFGEIGENYAAVCEYYPNLCLNDEVKGGSEE